MLQKEWEGLIEGDEVKRQIRTKSNEFDEKTVKKGTEQSYLDSGWEILRENLYTFRIRRRKPNRELFINQIWTTLARMGFDLMNSDHNFELPNISDKNIPSIDVFAADENVAVIVKCVTPAQLESKSLSKYIDQLKLSKGDILKSIRSELSGELRVGFALAVNNVSVSNDHLKNCRDNRIAILNESDFDYYDSLRSNIGTASKFQFLSDVFENSPARKNPIRVPAIRGKMGGRTFYSFVTEPSNLLPIAYVAHRVKNRSDGDLTYQRMVSKSRIKEIRKYVEDEKGSFPNSIILNFDKVGSKGLEFHPTSQKSFSDTGAVLGHLVLPTTYKSAWIIDGQHRLYGFTDTTMVDKVTVPVIAFENIGPEDQARMFIDINSKQTKVSSNLLQELYSDLHWYSDNVSYRLDALISKIVIELGKQDTPLKGRIVLSGGGQGVTITTLTAALKRQQMLGKIDKRSNTADCGPLGCARESRMKDSLKRAVYILSNYFGIFADIAPDRWNASVGDESYLCTNNAIVSELILLRAIFNHIYSTKEISAEEYSPRDLICEIEQYVTPVAEYFKEAPVNEIKLFKQRLGAHGQQASAFAMMKIVHEAIPQFNPKGLAEYIERLDTSWNLDSTRLVRDIQIMISDDVISTLKEEFGAGEDGWWREGVPLNIREENMARGEREKNVTKREERFYLLDYKKIIDRQWTMFREKYGFKDQGNRKDDQLKWFDRLNAIRNLSSHPEKGNVSEEDYRFLEELNADLKKRLAL